MNVQNARLMGEEGDWARRAVRGTRKDTEIKLPVVCIRRRKEERLRRVSRLDEQEYGNELTGGVYPVAKSNHKSPRSSKITDQTTLVVLIRGRQ